MDVEVVNVGMVDSLQKANESAALLKQADVELLFLFISTYALSSTVLPVAQQVGKPVVMLNMQPVPAINYQELNSMGDRGKMTGEWLAHARLARYLNLRVYLIVQAYGMILLQDICLMNWHGKKSLIG